VQPGVARFVDNNKRRTDKSTVSLCWKREHRFLIINYIHPLDIPHESPLKTSFGVADCTVERRAKCILSVCHWYQDFTSGIGNVQGGYFHMRSAVKGTLPQPRAEICTVCKSSFTLLAIDIYSRCISFDRDLLYNGT
jgi:hypothetical protein